MKRLLLTIAFLLMAAPLMAQTITFGWDAHSQAADITGFKLYASKQSGTFGPTAYATFTGGTLTTGTVTKPASPGKWYFVLTAFMTDAESDYSNEVNAVIKPNKPSGFRITAISAMTYPVRKIWQMAFNRHKNLRIVEEN